MSTPPSLSVSDALSRGIFRSGGERTDTDLALSTRIVDEILGVTRTELEPCLQRNLERLRGMCACDSAFLAILHPEDPVIERVHAACSPTAQAAPEGLVGRRLDALPWLTQRLEHLRVTHVTDAGESPQPDLPSLPDPSVLSPSVPASPCRLTSLKMGAVLVVCLHVQDRIGAILALGDRDRRRTWEGSLQVLLKLIASSIAAMLTRLALEARHARLEERNELAQSSANDGLWDFDAQRNDVYFSPRWKAMLGYREDEMCDASDWRSLVHPDDLPRVQEGLQDHISGRTPVFESQHRLRHRSGEWRWVTSRASARRDAQGRLLRLVGIELDITERKIYEDALFREKESAQITLQSIGDGVITTNADLLIDYINPVAEELTGWHLEDAMGRPVGEIFRAFHEETCEPLANPLSVAIRRARSTKSVRPMLLIRRDGNELYIQSTAAPIRDGQGEVSGGVLVFHDVSESRELSRRLSYHASHDPLTGLANRRELETRLARTLTTCREAEGTGAALCHLDIDQFKIINETCGHSAGDALLVQVGRLLKTRVRWRDTLARLGGDEFAILLEDTPLEEAVRTAEGLRESVHHFRFTWEDRVFRLGASIGVAPISAADGDAIQILSAADSACAAAKEAGRNRVHSFAQNDIELMRRRREMQWAARISTALEEDRFELFRMGIQPLQSSELGLHYELLVRLKDEAGRLVLPNDFIGAAERYGLAPAIDRWVIEAALRWLVSDAGEREKLEMCSINLSGQSLGDDKFLPFVIEQFRRSGVDGSKICFEITETAAVASISQAHRFIQALRELGCKFALDDFGRGLSSLSYLKHFPVDFLKIDGSFVREILRNPIDREMVRSINEIGHLTGKRTIAEFAENAEIIQILTSLGVDYAQGYGVALPQRVEKIAAA